MQPFFITDDIQAGVSYTLLHGHDPKDDKTIWRREEQTEEEWQKITDANTRHGRMYDDYVATAIEGYGGGSFLDIGCNSGYFPVTASLLGMKRSVGVDAGMQHGNAIRLLNEAMGSNAEFIHAEYDPRLRGALIPGMYDVVSASGVLCHMPDPLEFLAFLGSLAREAIFYQDSLLDTDELLVSWQKPDLRWVRPGTPFPYRFNDRSCLSRGMLYHAMEEMGFGDITVLEHRDYWLPQYISAAQDEQASTSLSSLSPELARALRLDYSLHVASKHVGVIATRRVGSSRQPPRAAAWVGLGVSTPPPTMPNVALGKPADQSSRSPWSTGVTTADDAAGAVSGIISGRFSFCTDVENAPWWQVDLGASFVVHEVRVYNDLRDLTEARRASQFAVDVSVDGTAFHQVFAKEDELPFGGADGRPFVWRPAESFAAHYLRLRLLRRDYLHLDQIEIYGEEFR